MSDFNLIPAQRRAAKRRRVRIRIWGALCGTYVVLLTAGAVTAGVLFSSEGQTIADQLTVTSEKIESHNVSMLDLRRALAEATAQLETWRILQAQPNWSKLLARLFDELGATLVLSHCQLTACDQRYEPVSKNLGGWFSSRPLGALLSETKYSLVLRGYGQTQAAVSLFVLRLEEIGLFDVVRSISSKRQPFLGAEAVTFHVECHF